MRIALDAMGGDFAPAETVKGALLAAKEFDVDIDLVGLPERIELEMGKNGRRSPRVTVVPASEVIAMEEEKIAQAVRTRRDASINVAMSLMRKGRVDAVVSAGNTGAVMASALLMLGRIRGIERPALDHIGFKVESVEAFKKDLETLVGRNPRLSPSPVGGGPEGAARLKLFQKCPYGKHQLADPDGVLIDVTE